MFTGVHWRRSAVLVDVGEQRRANVDCDENCNRNDTGADAVAAAAVVDGTGLRSPGKPRASSISLPIDSGLAMPAVLLTPFMPARRSRVQVGRRCRACIR